MRKSGLSLVALLVALLGASQAHSDGYTIESIALTGDTAPGTAGRTHSPVDVYSVDLNAAGEIAFASTLSGQTPAFGIFVDSGGAVSARALSDDPAPAPIAGSYRAFGYPTLGDLGEVSFGALVYTGAPGGFDALILDSGSGQSVLASQTDPAPSAGGTLDVGVAQTSLHARPGASDPVYWSGVSQGSAASGIFQGTARAIALEGASSPAGGSFASFWYPGANAAGKVAFTADLSGASAASGVFVDTGSGPSVLVLEGASDGEGETFLEFALPKVNARGDVMFVAEWSPVDSGGGLYVVDAGGLRSAVRTADTLPGGGSVVGLGGPADIADDGSVAFSSAVIDGAGTAGVFVADPNGALHSVVRAGDPVPGLPGESFASFVRVAVNEHGQVAFGAVTSGGLEGIFLASAIAQPVPSLSPLSAGVLAALLAAAPAVRTRRVDRSRSSR